MLTYTNSILFLSFRLFDFFDAVLTHRKEKCRIDANSLEKERRKEDSCEEIFLSQTRIYLILILVAMQLSIILEEKATHSSSDNFTLSFDRPMFHKSLTTASMMPCGLVSPTTSSQGPRVCQYRTRGAGGRPLWRTLGSALPRGTSSSSSSPCSCCCWKTLLRTRSTRSCPSLRLTCLPLSLAPWRERPLRRTTRAPEAAPASRERLRQAVQYEYKSVAAFRPPADWPERVRFLLVRLRRRRCLLGASVSVGREGGGGRRRGEVAASVLPRV